MKRVVCCCIAPVLLLSVGTLIGRTYKGAEYRTIDSYLYGRFEVRYRAPAGNGMLASFFSYHEIQSTADWNEIDFEILGRYDHDVQMTTIGPARATRNSHIWVPFNPHEAYHTYTFEWTPDYIAWFVDGIEYQRQTGAHIAEFNRPQKIMMNIWPPVAENWSGVWDEAILPVFAYYDWVSYASYKPDSGSIGTGRQFRPEWRDEFDGWDQSRWQKATHTFDGNNCDFIEENAVFEDGQLILCLTTADQTGYIDLRSPKVLFAHARIDAITLYFSEPLDSTSAKAAANYYISGSTIQEVNLRTDNRTVDLRVSDLDPEKSYTLSVLGVSDASVNKNKLLGQTVRVQPAEPLKFPVRINLGPDQISGFLPDQSWNPAQEYGYQDGYEESLSSSIDIGGTTMDSVYRTARREVVGYKIRVPDGLYTITFMLAEIDATVTEKPRLFNITAENIRVADSVDIYAAAGMNQAFDIVSQDVEVDDGILDIHLSNLTNFSLLSGLVVERSATAIGVLDHEDPAAFVLYQNFPNPFNAATTIAFNLPRPGNVSLSVYDINGRSVRLLDAGYRSAGMHRVSWMADPASGIYFLRLQFEGGNRTYQATRKMVIIR